MKTFFRKKCPECGKKSRLVFYRKGESVFLCCPNCGFEISCYMFGFHLESIKSKLLSKWEVEIQAAKFNSVPTEKPILSNIYLKEGSHPKHAVDINGKPITVIKEGKEKKGGINKPPTTPKPKMKPKGQGK